jgi:CRISPR-associated protein Cmr6
LQPFYRAANEAHPGLLIQRGLALYDQDSEAGREAKTSHLRRICAIPASDFYQHAYARWEAATANPARFRQVRLELLSRLFIGLSGGGMLETGCAISHSYGTPYIPGSSLKGVVRSVVRGSHFAQTNPRVMDELFGVDANPDGDSPAGLSGLVCFHDAWWVPGSAPTPLVEEVVTTHHLEYYGQEGAVPASDTDSPIPNAQLAVRGQFLFVLEGPPAWLDLAEKMLTAALAHQGIGAKTRTGYGLFDPAPKVPPRPTCPWVDETIASLMMKNRASELDTLRGKALAEAWAALADPALKTEALADIQTRWQENGWWDDPPGRSAQIKAIYTANG